MSEGYTTESGTMQRIRTPIDDDEIREIVEKGRSLSIGDDAVKSYGLPVSGPLTSLLFTSEVFDSSQAGPDENVIVRLENAPVTFEGKGEGYIHFDVVADPDTYKIESLVIRAHLDG
jgi:hypothetical protein